MVSFPHPTHPALFLEGAALCFFFGLTASGRTSRLLRTVEMEGLLAVALMTLGKPGASAPGILLPTSPASRPLSGFLRIQLHSRLLFQIWAPELSPRLAQSGSTTRAQCRMDHTSSCKHLTVTLLGTSPGWSLGPAGLRVREPCLTPSRESCHST